MGVPAFFRWLSRKYPSVIIECVEQKTVDDEGNPTYRELAEPNPNGIEFDNLYLDMNGIIHPCTHPEDKPPPKDEDEMMVAIFECIDRLFNIVRPRKLLYMAIDGVAPRAKMNQQRSRRFRASKEAVEKQLTIKTIREELTARGVPLPPEKPKEEHFDSNCITPGTPFMERLSTCLHYYIHDRMNSVPGWKNIKVILSDANVPGEGEHKLMDYIRRQRAQPDHDPNTQHVLCGADADLIMLGLATHEPNFTIIREEFLPNKPRPCEICGGLGHEMAKCNGLGTVSDQKFDIPISKEVQFIFVRLSVLKEYLRNELSMPNLPFPYDFERVIDDWVFMCFFVGNDFLPHLPSLEIREGAIDRLITIYKKCVYKTKGYLTDSGDVNLDRVQMIMNDLGQVEDEIFKNRRRSEEQFKMRQKRDKKRRMHFDEQPDFKRFHGSQFAPTPLGRGVNPDAISNPRQQAASFRMGGNSSQGEVEHKLKSIDAKTGLETLLVPEQQRGGTKLDGGQNTNEPDEEPEPNDEVRLWEDGFKDRYYESKFDVMPDNLEFRYSVALQYVRGLCWVLKYYYQGCASWKWYFPYHYAPFASDFVNITGLSTQFERDTKPFNPLEQLMGVFPAASGGHVPEPWRDLMSNPRSPIIDFYPIDFTIDLNGKKFAWQGVALLPFVDETRLFSALKPFYHLLTDGERKRNIRGENKLYVAPENSHYKLVQGLYNNESTDDVAISFQGMQGTIVTSVDAVQIDETLESPVRGLQSLYGNKVLSVNYKDPQFNIEYIFPARRLPNAIDPPTILKQGSDSSTNYRAKIGFHQDNQRARLGDSGHRMVNRGFNANVAPPSSYQNNDRGNQFSSGGSYQNNYGGSTSQGNGGGRGGRGFQQNNVGGGNWRSNDGGGGGRGGGGSWRGSDGGGRGGGGGNWRSNNGGGGGNWRSNDGGGSGNWRSNDVGGAGGGGGGRGGGSGSGYQGQNKNSNYGQQGSRDSSNDSSSYQQPRSRFGTNNSNDNSGFNNNTSNNSHNNQNRGSSSSSQYNNRRDYNRN